MVLLKHILVLGVFVGLGLLCHFGAVAVHEVWHVSIHRYWPLSIFLFKQPVSADMLTLLAIGLIMASLWRWYRERAGMTVLIFGLLMMMAATNLLAGVTEGFVQPVAGVGPADFGYWQDAALIRSVPDFVRHYVWLQPTLGYHSRVHPPGAVLAVWAMRQVLVSPPWVALFLAVLSVLGAAAVYGMARGFVGRQTAMLTMLIYGLLPAVQIYGLASIDGFIASVFAATAWAALRRRWWLTVGLLWLASTLTFGVVWLVPLVFFIEWQHKRQWWWSFKVCAAVGVAWLSVAACAGYAYWDSFWTAAAFEGSSKGLWMLHRPGAYVLTRLEDILEPLVFLGPWVLLLVAAAFRPWKRLDGAAGVGKAAGILFGAFLLTGAYYTGETARAALFVVAPLVVAIAPVLEKRKLTKRQQLGLLCLVLGQTVVMQLFGWYGW